MTEIHFCKYDNIDKFSGKQYPSILHKYKLCKDSKIKAKEWQKATQLVCKRQSQAAMADTNKLSSFSLSELPVDQSGPPTMIHRPHVPLSISTPVCMPSDNQQTTDATQDETSFQQVIPNISQQSFYQSLVAMGTSINTSVSPSIPFSRRVINDKEEHQRRVFKDSVEGANRGTNTSPVPNPSEQEEENTIPNTGSQARITPAEMQEETLQLESLEIEDTGVKQVSSMQNRDLKSLQAQNIGETEVPGAQDTSDTQIPDDGTDSQLNGEEGDPDIPDDQTSKTSQEDNYHTAINDDE